MERVLLIVNAEHPSQDLYAIINGIRENGYNVSVCCSKLPSEKSEKVKPDFHMDETLCLDNYSGVIFMDDGGDESKALEIAGKANKSGLAIGAYGEGVLILDEAKLLDNKQVANFPSLEVSDKAKKIDSPSVRCENIVTSTGNCPDGFVIVFVDALGGEIKRVIKGKDNPLVPSKAAMVVSEMNKWPEYWHLAQKLYEKGVGLVLVPWENIDLKKATISDFLILSPAFNPTVKRASSEWPIPKRCWFKQTAIGKNATIEAIKSLEKLGVRNVNSSTALSLTSDKMASASIFSVLTEQGNPKVFKKKELQTASSLLLSKGSRWIKPVDDSLGRKVMRVIGHGNTCILSGRHLHTVRHFVLSKNQLERVLAKTYKDEFMVQDNLGEITLGDRCFELRFIMRRTASGWQPSCEIARSGLLLSNPQNYSKGQILKACTASELLALLYEDDSLTKLGQLRELAEKACLLLQAQLNDPNELSELCVDITINEDDPRIIEVNGVPNLSFADEIYANPGKLQSFASLYRLKPIVYSPMTEQEWKRSRGDMADALSEGPWDENFCDVLRAELAYESIWPQPDGKVAMHVPHEKKLSKMTIDEALEELKREAHFSLDRFEEREDQHGIKEFKKKLLMKSIHRLLVLREYKKHSCKEEIVRVAQRQPTGPFQYISPELGRATPYEELGLSDYDPYKQEVNRPRRHPEYGGVGSILRPGDFTKTIVNFDQFRSPYSIRDLRTLIDEGGIYPFSRMNWESDHNYN